MWRHLWWESINCGGNNVVGWIQSQGTPVSGVLANLWQMTPCLFLVYHLLFYYHFSGVLIVMFFCDLRSQAFICLVFLVDRLSSLPFFYIRGFPSCYVMKQVKFLLSLSIRKQYFVTVLVVSWLLCSFVICVLKLLFALYFLWIGCHPCLFFYIQGFPSCYVLKQVKFLLSLSIRKQDYLFGVRFGHKILAQTSPIDWVIFKVLCVHMMDGHVP